jgi:translocation and assembly module TamB
MRRRALVVTGKIIAGFALLCVVAVATFLASAPGHALARRLLVAGLERALDGRVTIGSLSGLLWHAAELRDVELATPDGHPVIRIRRLAVSYSLVDLVRGRFVFSRVALDRLTVVLESGADGYLNLEHLFKLVGASRGPPSRRPLVELRGVRVTDGTFVLRGRPDSTGSVRVRSFLGLGLDLERVRASHPDSVGVVVDVRRLRVSVTDPAVRVMDASGRVVVEGDSARFDLTKVALPGTAGAASGVVRWGKGAAAVGATLDLAANLRRASFADFRWAVNGLPETGGGPVAVRARLSADGGSRWSFRDADLRTGRSHVRGSAGLVLGPTGAVTIQKLGLDAEPLDLAMLEPWLGPMPVAGLVTGRLTADGTPESLTAGIDVAFTDEQVPGRPGSRLAGAGLVTLGGRDGFAFHHFAVARTDLALSTIERLAPSITLHGRLGMSGDLDGPWRDATFTGTLSHADGAGAASLARGMVHLTLADTVRIDADLVADSLSLDDLAKSYPAIRLTGSLAGEVRVSGPVTALAADATLSGPAGGVRVHGEIAVRDSLVRLHFDGWLDSVDVAPLASGAPETRLTGTWKVDLTSPTADTATPATGSLAVVLTASRVAGVEFGHAGVTMTLTPERLKIDTAYVEQTGISLAAAGALGRAGQPAGQLSFVFHADTLADLAPLISWLRGAAGDTSASQLDVYGPGRVTGRIVGTTDAWEVLGDVTVGGFGYGSLSAVAAGVSGSVAYSSHRVSVALRATADSLTVAGMHYARVGLAATGPLDSLRLQVGGAFALGSSMQADVALRADSSGWVVLIENATLTLPQRIWTLAGLSRVAVTHSWVALDSLELRAQNGSRVRVAGRIPLAEAAGNLTLAVDSVPLSDLYALAQMDTVGIGGALSGKLDLAGTAANPRMRVSASWTDGRFGDFRAPLVEASADYDLRRLTVHASLKHGSEQVVTVFGSLPLDLALQPVKRRRLSGSLEIRVVADSVDLAVLNALTSLVRGVEGKLTADVTVRGTWERPELRGRAHVSEGAMSIPAIGARYSGIEARMVLSDTVLAIEEMRVRGGSGSLEVGGSVRLDALTQPVLDLTFTARNFAAFSQRNFAGLTGSGALSLKGPLLGATLAGRLVVDDGFLTFTDLVEKRIVNLDDPEFRAIVDSALAEATGLGPSAENVFLDSLRIQDLTVVMGPDVWLRSHEANIQLAGEFTVTKEVEGGASRYRLDGELRAVRGTYRLAVGPTSKEFRVTRGAVRFFGTPDFNPSLDIAAEHTVRSLQGNDLVVRVLIGGTLLVPRLSLESDERPPLSEAEIVSYLLFGRPSFDLVSGGGAAGSLSELAIFQGAVVGLAGVLSGELEQTLVVGLGLPVDYIAIRPGGGSDIFGGTRVEAGTQIGSRTFLTLNAGLCQVTRGPSSQMFGASVEYRLTGGWTAAASVEPSVQECRPTGFQILLPGPYQFGFDLFWQSSVR